jgi:hypothetical protein
MIIVNKYLLFDLFIMLVSRLPMLLLFFGATIWAVVRRKVHPQASQMVLIASFIYLLDGLFFTVFPYEIGPVERLLSIESIKTERWLYSGIYFFENFARAAIILLVVGAAFSDRSRSLKATS